MAPRADATQKALEEFDNRVRELLQRSELEKKKRTKKRAKPTRPQKVVVEQQQFHVPAEKADEAERKLLSLVINSVIKNNVPAAEIYQALLVTITPEQIEKLRSVFAPEQIKGMIEHWESVRKTGKLVLH